MLSEISGYSQLQEVVDEVKEHGSDGKMAVWHWR